MFVPQWNNRKRERDQADDGSVSGFSEHRMKRRIATLPDRTSPRPTRQISPFVTNFTPPSVPPTITPADSDSEETPRTTTEPKSFFSPYSSSPSGTFPPSSPCVGAANSSQSSHMSDVAVYSDDYEMADSSHLSPAPYRNDPATSLSGRVPTPIHSSFATHIRAEKTFRHSDPDFADDEALVERFRRGRRLPSPISEGEMSPSIITDGLGGMQMDVESESGRETPTKKGHTRSKHSLRSWTGGGELGVGMKRTFTLGYRADCEKCRNKVPGHFSHIITS